MITYGRALTQRIPIDRTTWHAVRCAINLHPWARWERMTAMLTEKRGRVTSEREVFVQARECIGCGLGQMKHL